MKNPLLTVNPTPVAPVVVGPAVCQGCGDFLWWDGLLWRERRPGHPPRFGRHSCPRTRPLIGRPTDTRPPDTAPLHVITEYWRTHPNG